MRAQEFVNEKWSEKYKRSINCSNPQGFSQRAHCAGRKKNEDLAEFAIDKPGDGDGRSKLIGSIVRLLQAGNRVDFFVPGIRGHVVGSGGNGDWLTLKRWKKPYSKVNYSLALDASDDNRFALKMINPDYYQVVEKDQLNEFAPPGDNDGDRDPEEILFGLAKQWWLGTEQDMIRAERTLASMGWEIGQDEGYDNGGVFVVRAGDDDGKSFISWSHEDLTSLNELTFKGSPCTKDCSGHRAGYEWSRRKGGVDAASWSRSFNNGAALFKNGY